MSTWKCTNIFALKVWSEHFTVRRKPILCYIHNPIYNFHWIESENLCFPYDIFFLIALNTSDLAFCFVYFFFFHEHLYTSELMVCHLNEKMHRQWVFTLILFEIFLLWRNLKNQAALFVVNEEKLKLKDFILWKARSLILC